MKTITEFPHEIEVLDPVFIEMSDGVRLVAKIWKPKGTEQVPAILEYLPYRRSDGTAERDALTHPYFAGHGYAAIRVDMRGSGDSEGVMEGEYLKQEQDDALEVINWITAQPWCSGSVGMIGISWGGFNGLQVAARQPEALKAIVSICSTDDRYSDDIHYMGGCLMMDNPWWSSYMFSLNTTPPDPLAVGDRWKEIWLERLKGSGFWISDWLRHQRRDDFWKHGSVCEDFSQIKAAVYAVGGWADGYSNAVFRLMEGLDSPCKGLVGPWAHKYPHFAKPGPAIGFLQECLRWWDYWLKGIETGIMDEPALRAWVQDGVSPQTFYDHRPGRWAATESWPSQQVKSEIWHLNSTGLEPVAKDAQALTLCSPQTVGMAGGRWCAFGLDPDGPGDQRAEAGGSLVFDTPVLEEDFDILGAAELELELESDQPVAMIAAVLSDVMPDGAATRVSCGVLNLTHRDDHEHPTPLTPGKRYRVTLKLNDCGHRFAAGHKLRIALSTTYWPVIWPMPEKVTLRIVTGQSTVALPVRHALDLDAELPEFLPPEGAEPLDIEQLSNPKFENGFQTDLITGEVTYRLKVDEGRVRHNDHDGWTTASTHEEIYRIHPDDPLSASFDVTWTEEVSRGAWHVTTRTRTRMHATKTHFVLKGELEAHFGEDEVYRQTWDEEIPRDLV